MSRHDDFDRAISLAGVVEAATLVAEAARTGSVHQRDLQRAFASLFTFNAETSAAAMGGREAIKPALRLLREQLAKPSDADVTRYGITLLHHARELLQQQELISPLHSGLEALGEKFSEVRADDSAFIDALAELYSETVSVIKPRILVRGDPDELAKPQVAALVRALLLCGVRAAVLWHQCGGNRWRLLLGRRALIQACETLIARD